MAHLLSHRGFKLSFAIATICVTLIASAAENEIIGSDGGDRLVGTPGPDYFVGGAGADVFVINHLSSLPDEIADFDPEEGDTIELTFDPPTQICHSKKRTSQSIGMAWSNTNSVTEIRSLRLNRSDLRLELDPGKAAISSNFRRSFNPPSITRLSHWGAAPESFARPKFYSVVRQPYDQALWLSAPCED